MGYPARNNGDDEDDIDVLGAGLEHKIIFSGNILFPFLSFFFPS